MKKPIGVFIKDTHLHIKTVDIVRSIFSQTVSLCKKLDVPLFHAGDNFTARTSQPLEVLNVFKEILDELEEKRVVMFAIAGNHCKVDQEDERSYLTAFERHPNLKVFSKQESVDFGDIVIHFLPYFKENGSYKERLESLQPIENKKNLLLTHIAVNGVKNNDGSGVENDLSKDLFDRYDLTMVGHYHDESWIGDKIWYFPGSYQANFGESTKKGCVIVYDDLSTEFIQLKFPKFIKHTVNLKDEDSETQIKELVSEHKNSSDNIRIVFEGDEADLNAINKQKFDAIGIDVKFDKNDLKVDLNTLKTTQISFDKTSILEVFDEFCDLNEIEDKEFGLEYLKQ